MNYQKDRYQPQNLQYSMEYNTNVAKTCLKKTNNITKGKCLHFQKETKK